VWPNNIAIEYLAIQNDENFDPQFNTEFMHMQQYEVQQFIDMQQNKNILKNEKGGQGNATNFPRGIRYVTCKFYPHNTKKRWIQI